MSQTLPIALTAVPVPVTVKAMNINQLLAIVCQYVQGSVQTDVSFFQTVSVDPTALTTPIIFNTTQRVFKYWDTGVGAYLAITQFQPGDIKNTFVDGDSPQLGWIVCDGRKITDVIDISQAQQGVLIQLFGNGGSLPDLTPMMGVSGLPAANAFDAIIVADTQPPANQIANLPFSSDYNPIESQNLAGNAEALRGSQNDLRTAVVNTKAVSQAMLTAIVSNSQTIVACVFVGYP